MRRREFVTRLWRGHSLRGRSSLNRCGASALFARAGIEPGEVENVIVGCAMPERATGQNIARLSAVRADLPVTVSGVTVNRFCSSGLQAIAMAAHRSCWARPR
jgi:acetyl-CoA C-acetyltransferase